MNLSSPYKDFSFGGDLIVPLQIAIAQGFNEQFFRSAHYEDEELSKCAAFK